MKKTGSLVLALVLAAAMLPGAAVNASAATVLTEVDFTVTAPSAGTTSREAPRVSVREKDDYTLEWTGWSTAEGYEPEETITFSEGETYYLLVKIKANDGYDFYYNTQAEAAFIGEGSVERTIAMNNNDSTGYSSITYLLSVKAGEAKFQGRIDHVFLDVKPVLGRRTSAAAPKVTTPGNKGYAVTSAVWCDSKGDPLTEEITFTAGETYYISVLLTADEGCGWNQLGTLQTTVTGGMPVGNMMTTNSTMGCWAEAVLSVVAAETPERVVLDVNPSFTPPAAGTQIVYDHSSHYISATPEPASFITIPEGADFAYSPYWTALWCEEDGEALNSDYTIYAGLPYYFEIAIKPLNGKYFDMEYTEISVENAETVSVEMESGYLFIVFRYTVAPGENDCQILFDPNTGEGAMPALYVPAGMTCPLPECGFTHEAANFTGWLVNGEELQPRDDITVTGNTVVKAVWVYKTAQSDNRATDSSTATVLGVLELTDPATGETTTVDVSSATGVSEFGNPLTDTVKALVDGAKEELIAKALGYGIHVEVTDENPDITSLLTLETWDNRVFSYVTEKDDNGNYHMIFRTTGDYGHKWQVTVTLKAEGSVTVKNVLLGDANGDGFVDINDVTAIQRHAAEYIVLTGERFRAADIDGDGVLTISDATILQRFLAEYETGYPISQMISSTTQ